MIISSSSLILVFVSFPVLSTWAGKSLKIFPQIFRKNLGWQTCVWRSKAEVSPTMLSPPVDTCSGRTYVVPNLPRPCGNAGQWRVSLINVSVAVFFAYFPRLAWCVSIGFCSDQMISWKKRRRRYAWFDRRWCESGRRAKFSSSTFRIRLCACVTCFELDVGRKIPLEWKCEGWRCLNTKLAIST